MDAIIYVVTYKLFYGSGVLNESLSQESQKVGTLTSLTTTIKTSIVNAINSIVSLFNNLGAFNPKTVLSSTGNFVITMPENADFVQKTINFSKNVNQLMPFFVYTDGFYNCKPTVAVAIDGKNVTLTIMGTKINSSAQSLQL